MYGIYVRQKKALKNAVKRYCQINKIFPRSVEDLPEYDTIGDMNPCEVYWQYANQYTEELRFSREFDYMFHKSEPW